MLEQRLLLPRPRTVLGSLVVGEERWAGCGRGKTHVCGSSTGTHSAQEGLSGRASHDHQGTLTCLLQMRPSSIPRTGSGLKTAAKPHGSVSPVRHLPPPTRCCQLASGLATYWISTLSLSLSYTHTHTHIRTHTHTPPHTHSLMNSFYNTCQIIVILPDCIIPDL